VNPFGARQRKVLRWILGVLAAAVLLMQTVASAPQGHAGPLPLELTGSAVEFRTILLRDWVPEGVTEQTVTGFPRLRANLLLDSVLLVPGYVALLVFFTLAFGPAEGRPWRQWLCVPAVAAGLLDIAENSMTGRALDDLMQSSLVDATVADVTLASRLKWALLGIALMVLAWRVWAAAPAPWRALPAAACTVAALVLMAGAAWVSIPVIVAGMVALAIGLGALAWRAWR